jgi:hypothetical protein
MKLESGTAHRVIAETYIFSHLKSSLFPYVSDIVGIPSVNVNDFITSDDFPANVESSNRSGGTLLSTILAILRQTEKMLADFIIHIFFTIKEVF